MDSRPSSNCDIIQSTKSFLGDSVDSRLIELELLLHFGSPFLGDSVDSRLAARSLSLGNCASFWGIVWTAGFG